jgi:hypothetical protein
MKNKVVIEYETKDDGKLYLTFKTVDGKVKPQELVTILCSALSMTVKMTTESLELTPQDEGKMVREILTFLSNDFFDNNSFNDLEFSK